MGLSYHITSAALLKRQALHFVSKWLTMGATLTRLTLISAEGSGENDVEVFMDVMGFLADKEKSKAEGM